MAATRVIEQERGTVTGTPRNPHQGYYAGDFSGRPFTGFTARPEYAERTPTTHTPTGRF
jgi:hypothetical protein